MYYPELTEAKYVDGYIIWISFSDGSEGEVDLESQLYGEVFEPLKDKTYFKTFTIHPELKVLSWDCGADFAPEYIYNLIKSAA